ncbi:hypothetical protein BRETT_005072 [Brettanomyces bruxellensis]|uniref:ABC transporter domain-containing protein n=1 Tax=Dekkera bruxellensis TaxID=5007 RepID=A0A871R8D0_DEKBR|nr:uncharacterized protein BRETT_005072 [Brettanomyces bruxellensis]QOU20415.1 hypothetical protein BRETT_005072 [Brettanomyces bruxellensis]
MDCLFSQTVPTAALAEELSIETKLANQCDESPIYGAQVASPGILKQAAADLGICGSKQQLKLADKISFKINPGRLCLILGNPSHINSGFLKGIAGVGEKNLHKKTGKNCIRYTNYVKKSQLVYCGYEDVHFPCLTVKQTLDFSLRWRFPRLKASQRLEIIMKLLESFGMQHTLNTRVGDDFYSGISGGERRRLSLLEALVAGGAITCLDNATRGLDSATAGRVLDVMRSLSHKYDISFVMTLYQGSEEVYERFDDVLVLFQGKQVYFGPADGVESYFNKLGYHKTTSRQTTMEMVDLILDTELSLEQKQQTVIDKNFDLNRVPRTPAEFASAWESSTEYQNLMTAISSPDGNASGSTTFDSYKSQLEPRASSEESVGLAGLDLSPAKGPLRVYSNFCTCFRRNFTNNVRNWLFYTAQMITMIFLAICIGTLFFRLDMDTMGSFSRGSVIFFALLLFTFIAVSEVQINFGNSLVISRQACNYRFYQPWIDSFSDILAEIPFKLLEELIFLIVFYFLVGLNGDASGFFSFYLFLSITVLVVDEFYHMIARLSSTIAVATSLSGLALLWLAMYATYVVQQQQIKVWFKYWLMYTDPLMYAFESLITTQLHGKIMHCNNVIPSGNKFYDSFPFMKRICAWQGASLGNDFVRGDEYVSEAFGYKYSHVWRNLGILFGFLVGFSLIELVGIQMTIGTKKSKAMKLVKFPEGKKTEGVVPAENDPAAGRADGPANRALPDAIKEMRSENSADGNEYFAWKDLTYTLPSGKCLLHEINGSVKRGQLVALMGSSGAGKTTLLNALSGRYAQGSTTSTSISPLPARIGYVEQQEMFVEELTVFEALKVYADLHGKTSKAPSQTVEEINSLILLLSLTKYRNFQLKSLPLEQRKKVSLGIELVNRPSLLFVDEITSGLDDLSAYNIICCLRDLARNVNIAILCTVHQPSPSLITLFDNLLLLKSGGYQAYYGPISSTLNFFSHHNLRPCRKTENVVDYMIQITADESVDWSDYWKTSQESQTLQNHLGDVFQNFKQEKMQSLQSPRSQDSESPKLSYRQQFNVIFRRSYIEMRRNENYICAKLGLYVFSGLFIGFSFFQIDHSIKSLQSSMFAIFLVLCVCSPLIHQVQNRCNSSKLLYEMREFRLYHWSVLPLCQVVLEVAIAIIGATLSYLCFFFTWSVNNNSTRAGYFYLDYAIMFQLYYVTYAIGVLYFSPNELIADVYASLFFALMVVFCGAMQPFSMIPAFWKYTVYYESPFTYFLENMMTELFDDRPVICDSDEFALLMPQDGMTCGAYMKDYIKMKGGYLKSSATTIYCTYCTYASGQEFTNNLHMYFKNHWRNFGIMWAFVVGNVILMLAAYKCMLLFRSRHKPKKDVTSETVSESV